MPSEPEFLNTPEFFADINTDTFDLGGDLTLLDEDFSDIPTLVDYDFTNNIVTDDVVEAMNIPFDTDTVCTNN